jgi:hypothetical protein
LGGVCDHWSIATRNWQAVNICPTVIGGRPSLARPSRSGADWSGWDASNAMNSACLPMLAWPA